MTANATGAIASKLTITSNDPDSPTEVNITANALACEMSVESNSNCYSTPSADDHTDFGSADIAGGTVDPDDTTTLDFELKLKPGILAGTVVDANTSEPIVGATVQVGESSVQTDAEGKYQFTLEPGNYTVSVSAEKYVQRELPATVDPDETTTLDFELKLMEGILSGTIIDEDADPVSGAVVRVADQVSETDAQGKFELSVFPGEYEVSISATGYLVVSDQVEINPDDTTELTLSALAALEVWPGDTDNNGRVSILDILPIGRFWGKKGDTRTPQEPEWQMALTPIRNWSPEEAALADADGNGVVDENDVLVIAQNWRSERSEVSATPSLIDAMKLLADKEMLEIYRKMYQALGKMEECEGKFVLRECLRTLIDNLKPKESVLLANYPNPFNPETWIPFVLAEETDVVIQIYDIQGRLVQKLSLGRLDPGYYTQKDRAAHWDGKDSLGQSVASGMYYYALWAGRFKDVRKLVILK